MKKNIVVLMALTIFLFGCTQKGGHSSIDTGSEGIDSNNSSSIVPPLDEVPVESVEIVQGEIVEVVLGSKLTLQAKVLPENATNKKVSWKSSNLSVATINSGEVYSKSLGETTITLTSKENNEIIDTCLVKVIDELATGIVLNMTSLELSTGYSKKIIATVLPENTQNKVVTFKSDNENIAKVSSTGEVTGIRKGTTIVRAQIDGFEATCVVTVSQTQLPNLTPITPIIPETRPKQNNDWFYTTAESGYKDEVTLLGEGVELHHYYLPSVRNGQVKQAYSVIVDLSKASIEGGLADDGYTLNAPSATIYNQILAYQKNSPKKVLAAVNADYFGCGSKCSINNLYVKDGIVANARSAFKDDNETSKLYSGMMVYGVSYNNVPIITEGASKDNIFYRIDNMIDLYDAKGIKILQSFAIDAINNKLINDNYLGASKPRNTEVITENGHSVTNKNVIILEKIKMHNNRTGKINFPIDGTIVEVNKNYSGTIVLNTNQVAIIVNTKFINVATIGQLVRIGRTDSDNNQLDNMKLVIGGRHELIKDYKIVDTLAKETTNNAQTPRPRTAIGILGDGRVMIVAAGNGKGSGTGSFDLSLPDLADLMEYEGCKAAFNFDGGGSTRLLTDDGNDYFNVFVNSGENRRVVNTLFVTTK